MFILIKFTFQIFLSVVDIGVGEKPIVRKLHLYQGSKPSNLKKRIILLKYINLLGLSEEVGREGMRWGNNRTRRKESHELEQYQK